jgi:diguanylate cyclase (GGDEF)-like protein
LIEDVQKLKLRMGDCLETVREEASRQKTEGAALAQTLHQEVERSQQRIATIHNPEVDSCTGLPKRAAAEILLQEALEKPGRKYVVTAVVQRIHAINGRYGYAIGDRILDTMCQHFKAHLSSTDRLFRWNGPAIVAVLEREESLDHVVGEIRRISEARLEKSFDVGGRSVSIRVSPGWSAIPLEGQLNQVCQHIDVFVASQLPEPGI